MRLVDWFKGINWGRRGYVEIQWQISDTELCFTYYHNRADGYPNELYANDEKITDFEDYERIPMYHTFKYRGIEYAILVWIDTQFFDARLWRGDEKEPVRYSYRSVENLDKSPS